MPTIEVPALTQIEIEKVFQPLPNAKTWRDGAKRGAIKSKDGVKYQVKETLLKQFQDGESCQVEVRTFGDKDSPGREIVKKVGWNGQDGVPKQNTRQRMDPVDALEARKTAIPAIFAILAGWAHAGKLPVDRSAVKKALDELEAGIRMHTNPQRRDDLNDEIPEGDWATKSENPAEGIADTF